MTEHLVSYLSTTLAGAPDDCVTFQRLSDEETAVIETDDPSEYTVQPWIESQKHLDAASTSLFGRRSLYLRGLLTIETDPRTGAQALALSDELRFLADTRRLGVGYVLSRSLHRGERTARNHVLQSQVGAFEEDVDTDGFHHFSACTYRAALRRLGEWALPQPPPGPEVRETVPTRRWQRWAAKELGADVRSVEINLFLPDGSGDFATDTWYAASGDGRAVVALPDGDALNVSSSNSSRLEYLLAERVSSALGVQV